MRKPLRTFRLAPALLLSACVIPIGGAQVGDVRVTWSFDGKQRCAEVGVENVTVQLIEKGKEGKEDAKAFGQTAECIAGSMVIPDVVAGQYVMTAVGTGEVAVFNNDEGVTVDVVAGQLTDIAADLTLANGEVVSRIEFQYTFDGEPVCSAAGVDAINAQVVDDNGIAIAGSNTDCITGLAVVEGIRVGEHTLEVEAVDGDGNVRFVGTRELTGLQPGETLRLDPIDLAPALVDATVRFTFDGVRFCGAAGVEAVEAQLLDADGNVEQGQNIDCVVGSITFTDVPAGIYALHVDALDGNGEVQYTKDVEDLVLDRAEVDLGVVDLDALSSTVRVRFKLPDGLSCAEAGVDNVDIQIIDEDGNVTGTNVACVNGDSGDLEGPAPGDVDIAVQGIAGEDVIVSGSETGVRIEPGENVVEIDLVAVRTTLDLSWDFVTVVVPDVTVVADPITDTTVRCADADVDTINVRVLQGTTLVEAVSVACTAGRVELPGIPVGDIRIELEGTREQEGDSIYFGRDEDDTDTLPAGGDNNDVVATGVRTPVTLTLSPSLVFARVIWTGDCGVANAATVDIQVSAGGVSEGINVPCAEGNTLIAMPPGTEDSLVAIALRGVDGQGVPDADRDVISNIAVLPGINTFRFAGPR